jgi:hypothetical protein
MRSSLPLDSSSPIPAASPERQKAMERLVDRILAAKQRDAEADANALEREMSSPPRKINGVKLDFTFNIPRFRRRLRRRTGVGFHPRSEFGLRAFGAAEMKTNGHPRGR